VWTDKKLGADGHCDVEPGSAAADREKSGIVRRRRDNNLEKRRNRSEGALSLSEVPCVRGKAFWCFFAGPALRRLKNAVRSSGYTHKTIKVQTQKRPA
ncbi:hypothetical protein, partial [Pseudomonas sp. RA_105y_Pfl2_P56]|uniref:hypothetical protein n=1 Tax=Pseudomonas sp. RA_105y_Pfl2_P56 TaxID=3088701 RepID=UPI0030D89CEE